MSADSGLKTFRDAGGLWEGHDVRDVATPRAWDRNPELVLTFYNERRKEANRAQPHQGHRALAKLNNYFSVQIITQNVDDLHERAGSKNVVHLHGELNKVRSEEDPSLTYDIGGDAIELGDTGEDGNQLRPHVVWFGEPVPMMEQALQIIPDTDLLIVIGTSLAVYPAAGLTDYVEPDIPKFIIDPKMPDVHQNSCWTHIQDTAEEGTPPLVNQIIEKYS